MVFILGMFEIISRILRGICAICIVLYLMLVVSFVIYSKDTLDKELRCTVDTIGYLDSIRSVEFFGVRYTSMLIYYQVDDVDIYTRGEWKEGDERVYQGGDPVALRYNDKNRKEIQINGEDAIINRRIIVERYARPLLQYGVITFVIGAILSLSGWYRRYILQKLYAIQHDKHEKYKW